MTVALFIAIPVYSNPEPAFVASLRRLERALAKCGLRYVISEMQGESLITRARNRLVAAFRASECTHLLFLDSDLIFEPSDVLRLVHAGHDLCAAPYPAKGEGGKMIGNPVMIEGGHHVIREGFALAQDLPTGFMLIARSVFDRMARVVPEVDDDIPGSKLAYHVFFDCGIDGRQYLSEDWWFTRVARKCGIEAWIDVKAKLKHVGRKVYEAQSFEEQWAR